MDGLILHRPGIFSCLQDLGRNGYEQLGVRRGGAMDMAAHRCANQLLGNQSDAATVEILLGGVQLEATVPCNIALCGAAAQLRINDKKAAMWQSVALQPGDRIDIGQAQAGCRLYLAVSGGFAVSKQLGSVATVRGDQLGGLFSQPGGQALSKGNLLPCLPALPRQADRQSLAMAERLKASYQGFPQEIKIRLIPGYQYEEFNPASLEQFFSQRYQLSPDSDRMGCRFTGPKPIDTPRQNLTSEGLSLGAVQIPGDGQPIVMMRDHQSMGGYPKIGAVFSADINKIAQRRPGDFVRFERLDLDAAHSLLRAEAL